MIWLVSLILAPLLLFVSQFFWNDGVLTAQAGTFQFYSFVFWVFAFQALFSLVQDEMPRYAAWGFLIAVLSCMGGAAFGLDGIYSEALGITDTVAKNTFHEKMGNALFYAMYIPGLLFPISLLGIGISYIRSQRMSSVVGIALGTAAVGFPLSAMPRIQWLAQLDSLFFLILFSTIAFKVWQENKRKESGIM